MQKGTVKWFNENEGYGVIVPDAGGGDVLMRRSDFVQPVFQPLDGGVKVEFRPVDTEGGKVQAKAIKIIG